MLSDRERPSLSDFHDITNKFEYALRRRTKTDTAISEKLWDQHAWLKHWYRGEKMIINKNGTREEHTLSDEKLLDLFKLILQHHRRILAEILFDANERLQQLIRRLDATWSTALLKTLMHNIDIKAKKSNNDFVAQCIKVINTRTVETHLKELKKKTFHSPYEVAQIALLEDRFKIPQKRKEAPPIKNTSPVKKPRIENQLDDASLIYEQPASPTFQATLEDLMNSVSDSTEMIDTSPRNIFSLPSSQLFFVPGEKQKTDALAPPISSVEEENWVKNIFLPDLT